MASRAEAVVHPGVEDDPWVPRVFAVRRRRRETRDTWTLELAAPPASPEQPASPERPGQRRTASQDRAAHEQRGPSSLPGAAAEHFHPGQFNMLYVFGNGEIPISISGDPRMPGSWWHTVRAVGAVSRALTRLEVGASVGVRGPYGSAWPMEQAAGGDVLLIAGGLGLAPLRPAIYSVLAERGRYGAAALLYGARSVEEVLYRRELQRWQRRADLQVQLTVDHAGGGWRGNVGVVTNLIPAARFAPARTLAMVCGPEVMMRFSVAALLAAGVAPGRIYLSLERNMQCAIGHCGRCQFGPHFICRDGAVLRYDRIAHLWSLREI